MDCSSPLSPELNLFSYLRQCWKPLKPAAIEGWLKVLEWRQIVNCFITPRGTIQFCHLLTVDELKNFRIYNSAWLEVYKMVNLPTLSTSHFVNSHFVNIDQMEIDKVVIDKVGIDKVGINLFYLTLVLYTILIWSTMMETRHVLTSSKHVFAFTSLLAPRKVTSWVGAWERGKASVLAHRWMKSEIWHVIKTRTLLRGVDEFGQLLICCQHQGVWQVGTSAVGKYKNPLIFHPRISTLLV